MSREHELLTELRQARKRLTFARFREDEARDILNDRKADRVKAAGLVEEIMTEIETGKSGRPLIDAANGEAAAVAEPAETADERQRGPVSTVSIAPPEKPKRKTRPVREVVISPNGPNRQELPPAGPSSLIPHQGGSAAGQDGDTMSKPVFTQKMSMHLNGGSKFSELHYDVFRDGEPTGIRHIRRTNGSPKYLITDDVLIKGDESFDLKATKGDGFQKWLEAHSQDKAVTP